MRKALFSFVLILIVFSSIAQTEKTKNGHLEIRYDKDVEAYALAGAKILNFVCDNLEELGFNLPKKIKFDLVKSESSMLSIKGRKEPVITLEYITLDPNQVRANFVYGLCHEMGHSCMFYTMPKKNKGTTKAYHEGWAHVFGEKV